MSELQRITDQSCRKKVAASVVLHCTDERLFEKLFAALRNDAVSLLYVIDNSPVDCSCDYVEDYKNNYSCPEIIYIKCENNGYGAGHNIALRKSLAEGFEYHLVVNPDVRWSGRVVDGMTEYMDAHPEVGQTMPKTFYPDGRLQHTCRRLPSPWILFGKRFMPEKLLRNALNRYLLPAEAYDHVLNGPYLLGSFMLFRCEALKKEGLFDERFFMYPEDIDITRRLHRHWQTLLLPQFSIIHDHAAASTRDPRMLRIHILNMCKYFNKWGWFFDKERSVFNRRLDSQIPR